MASWSAEVRRSADIARSEGEPTGVAVPLGGLMEHADSTATYHYPLDDRMRAEARALAKLTGRKDHVLVAAQESVPVSLASYGELDAQTPVEVVVSLHLTLEEAKLLEPDGPPARAAIQPQ